MLLLALLPTTLAAPPVLNVLPFGVGVYAHKKPLRGVIYTVTQAGGAGLWYGATWPARYAADIGDDATVQRWQGVLIGAATLTIGSYIVSIIDGSRLHDLEVEGQAFRWDSPEPLRVGLALPVARGTLPRAGAVAWHADNLLLVEASHD